MRAHKDCGILWSGSVLYIFGVVGRPRICRWSELVCIDLSCLLFGVFWSLFVLLLIRGGEGVGCGYGEWSGWVWVRWW